MKTLLTLTLTLFLSGVLAISSYAEEEKNAATSGVPIGRDGVGQPLLAWSKPSASAEARRIIHLGAFPGEASFSSLDPAVAWFGLAAPLDTAAFPPQGKAFAPEHASAHAIWRWIGLTAPDAVLVPESTEGRALAEALRGHAPAGVGRVDVSFAPPTGEPVALPGPDSDPVSAKAEMAARLAREPGEVLTQVAAHYGDRFSGSYIEALALIVRTEAGLPHRATELAKAQLDKNPALPKNGGEISGTLLYAILGEPWAEDRVLAVANMAFDASGDPREAMPTHSEMSDAVFMGSPLLAEAARLSGDVKYLDAALTNYRFIAALCRRPDGIYRHSPLDEAAWGRGNGFPALGLALTLRHFPVDHPGHAEMREALCAHLEALAKHQNDEGMWHQIIDRPDSYAELTSTCMISYAIATALQNGWLDETAWRPRLEAAWTAVKRRVSTDGRSFINVCTGTGKQKSLEDYYLREAILGPDGRGAAMVMMLAAKLQESK